MPAYDSPLASFWQACAADARVYPHAVYGDTRVAGLDNAIVALHDLSEKHGGDNRSILGMALLFVLSVYYYSYLIKGCLWRLYILVWLTLSHGIRVLQPRSRSKFVISFLRRCKRLFPLATCVKLLFSTVGVELKTL